MLWNRKSKYPYNEEDFFRVTDAIADKNMLSHDNRLESDVETAKKFIPEYLHKYIHKTHLIDFVKIDIPHHYAIYFSNGWGNHFFVSAGGGKSFGSLIDAVVYAKFKE